MSLTFYYHPLSSYCHKTLVALYENDIAFKPLLVDLSNEESRNAFYSVWPIGKFPVIRDEVRGVTIPESSIIIEYLDQYYPGKTRFVPIDAEAARQTRARDRFFDLHIHTPMQKIVGDRIRPAGSKDPMGVEQAKSSMKTALEMFEKEVPEHDWLMGRAFSLADCSAAPALFYANKVMPLLPAYPKTMGYLQRLMARPSYARTLKEAEPYFSMFPQG